MQNTRQPVGNVSQFASPPADRTTTNNPSIATNENTTRASNCLVSRCNPLQDAPSTNELQLVQWEEWDESHQYNETPPKYILYSIEWKLSGKKKNKRTVARETEQNIVLGPSDYWTHFLHSKIRRAMKRQFPAEQQPNIDDTTQPISRIIIPGMRDERAQYAKAGEILLARGWDLELMYRHHQPDMLIQEGIWDGVAADRTYTSKARANTESCEEYTDVSLSHAHLYTFADRYDVEGLRELALYKLHQTLVKFTQFNERIGDPLLRGKARNLCASQYRQILVCARYLNTSGVLPVPPIPYTIQADLRDRDGQTPLLQAAANGHEGVVKALLATGKVEVDSKVGTAGTPLSWAAADGHAGVVKLLREYVPLNTYS
ncbi:hypothetical protein B0A54_17936 [Friedmanniomyces endolithicus]|uniref:Uncharacterized protein n=1 Tax=Friedmanniomyces endolithicus TaxID=329885 RepID=A0A4U0TQE5_9PEZI|nr:hypothetical protein B0A54_17936 [Friedmanniomyces endolithicus]